MGGAAVAALLAFAFAILSVSAVDDAGTWMASDWAMIANHTLSSIALPGSHDAGTYNLSLALAPFGYLSPAEQRLLNALRKAGFNYPETVMQRWSAAQAGSFAAQLGAGSRFLDIRVISVGGVFLTHHMLVSAVPLSAMLDDVAAFVNATSHECFVLDVSHLLNITGAAQLEQLFLSKLGFAMYGRAQSAQYLGWPTLSDMVAAGRRVIVMMEGSVVNLSPAFFPRVIASLWADSPNATSVQHIESAFFRTYDRASDTTLIRKLQWLVTEDARMVVDAALDPRVMPQTLLDLSFSVNALLFNYSVARFHFGLNVLEVDHVDVSTALDVARNLNAAAAACGASAWDTDPLCSQWLEWGHTCTQLRSRCARRCGVCAPPANLPGFPCSAMSATCNCVRGVCLSRNPRAASSMCVANWQCESASCVARKCTT